MDTDAPIRPDEIPDRLQAAGVAGAGGAGFPSYVKWQALANVDSLLVNHQESEPNYYADKWLGREHAADLVAFFETLLEDTLERVVVGTKVGYREEWLGPLEEAAGEAVYTPEDLPADFAEQTGLALVYTPNVYTYSEESVLLMVTAGVQLGDGLPTDHGWLVHNTESIFNVARALRDGTPVTRKLVQVDGNTPRHRCLDVPIGTPASDLLEAAGVDDGAIAENEILADGGPGWCYEIEAEPDAFGVRKRTNAVLVLDEDLARDNLQDDGQIDVLTAHEWDRDHETEPTRLEPDRVRIPLITNAAYTGFVEPSVPCVDPGDTVSAGDVVATPAPDSISNTQHASIDGTVSEVSETHVTLERS
ncbi:NADH dehydrogenase subunit [Natronobiforma cellulositropha]|uniref:NADH dehydrogenase subunit n=1 Tax=Natronobiforma cellulositropha TaxID=1679076 RepID=UPI0021D56CDE|nr:NADH dehydrogenase subunit [Natronobiforma cellulositropha]